MNVIEEGFIISFIVICVDEVVGCLVVVIDSLVWLSYVGEFRVLVFLIMCLKGLGCYII